VSRPSRRQHPLFARFYERLTRASEGGWEGEVRDELCADLTGQVLEVGAGNGGNLVHYREAAHVVACEPEPNMLRLAVPRAAEAAVPVGLVQADGEHLPFGDDAFDAVVCSLVLCTIPDPKAALREIRRILRPSGALRVYEHVRASSRNLARLQDLIERPWGLFAGGCHPNRDTVASLAAEGFEVRVRTFRPPVIGGALLPHVIGEARATGPSSP
jgi:ubiquinone/menaquinone biosynthesis C-methylase UbiE